METKVHNGVVLAYDDVGSGDHTLLLMHGLGSTRKMMESQVAAFSSRYRIVNIDLRGHGGSSKLNGRHHPDDLADDIAGLCAALELSRPIAIGHSMGGAVALRAACLHDRLLAAVIALDSAIAAPLDVVDATPEIVGSLRPLEGAEYRAALTEILGGFFVPHDDPVWRARIIESMISLDKDTFLGGWLETVVNTDTRASLEHLTIPLLYIGSEHPLGDLEVLRASPTVTVGQTIGSGHFHQVMCADQVNAMIYRFLYVNGWT